MSKLEYLLSIAYYLGRMDKEGIQFDLDNMDIEDFTTLCGVLLDDFYTQNELAYLSEFLNTLTPSYIDLVCDKLFN